MSNRFSITILSAGAIFALVILMLHQLGLTTPENEIYVRFSLIGLFAASIFLLFVFHSKKLQLFSKSSEKGYSLLVIISILLLISTIFQNEAGNFATGFFIGASLLFFILNRKFYPFKKIYVFLFLYAVMMILGTIGTPKGFRFPDTTLSFLLLPLAFCCFEFSYRTWMQIGHVFFRAIMVYMVICVLYWLFNFLYLDTSLFHWVSSKLFFDLKNIADWENQIRLSNGTTNFSAFYFVTSWAYYYHPSYISLTLFFGLIMGLYLYYKRKVFSTILKLELILYIVFCFVTIALMESRIGLVGLCFILIATVLYYSKLKTSHFKIIVFFFFVVAAVFLFSFDDTVDNFLADNIRRTDYTLAINFIKDHFWWGNGFSEQKAALEQQEMIMKDVLPPVGNLKTYTHNQFLGNMVQFGIWGLLVLVAMLTAFVSYSIKTRNYLLQMFLLVVILFMMIEEPLYGQKGFTIFSVFLTIFIAMGDSKKVNSISGNEAVQN